MKSQKKTAGNEKTEKEIVKSLQKITAGKKGLFSMQQITINIRRIFLKRLQVIIWNKYLKPVFLYLLNLNLWLKL